MDIPHIKLGQKGSAPVKTVLVTGLLTLVIATAINGYLYFRFLKKDPPAAPKCEASELAKWADANPDQTKYAIARWDKVTKAASEAAVKAYFVDETISVGK